MDRNLLEKFQFHLYIIIISNVFNKCKPFLSSEGVLQYNIICITSTSMGLCLNDIIFNGFMDLNIINIHIII